MLRPIQNDTFRKFIKYHQDKKEFLVCAMIGSVVRPEIKSFSDVDCLMLTTKRISHKQIINKTLSKFKSHYNNQSEDVLVYNVSNLRVSCLYMSQTSFLEYIKKVLDAHFLEIRSKPWVIGGKIEEVLLGDIKLSKIFFDKTNKFIKIKNSLAVYPVSFRIRLMNYLEKDIKSKIALQKKIMENDFLFNLGLYEIIISLIRYIYARQKAYLLPLKHITTGVNSKQLPIKYGKIINILLNLPSLKNKNNIIHQLEDYISSIIYEISL